MGIFLGWFIFSLIVGALGSGRNIGFWGSFLLSLFLSPLIGLIITFFSKDKADQRMQAIQQKTLFQIQQNTQQKQQSSNSQDVVSQLQKLTEMRDHGTISEEDFQKAKTKLIG